MIKPKIGEKKSDFIKRGVKDQDIIDTLPELSTRIKYLVDIYMDALEQLKLKPMEGVPGNDGKDGRDGKDGINGKNGIDGKDGRDGVDGMNGKNGRDGKDGKNGKDGRDGITTTIIREENLGAEEIKDRLESLKGNNRLDASAIKNLPQVTREIMRGGGGGNSSGGGGGGSVDTIVAGDGILVNSGDPANPIVSVDEELLYAYSIAI